MQGPTDGLRGCFPRGPLRPAPGRAHQRRRSSSRPLPRVGPDEPSLGNPRLPHLLIAPSPHDHVGDTTQREADSRVCPGAPASDSRSLGKDFSLQPDSRLHFPVQRAKVTSWGPTALRGGGLRWSPPTHHLQLRLPGGAWSWEVWGPSKPRPSRFVAGLLWERTAWWRRGGVRIPLLTPLRWPPLLFPAASPPAPSRHPSSLLGC